MEGWPQDTHSHTLATRWHRRTGEHTQTGILVSLTQVALPGNFGGAVGTLKLGDIVAMFLQLVELQGALLREARVADGALVGLLT